MMKMRRFQTGLSGTFVCFVCLANVADAQPGGGGFGSFLGLRSSMLIDASEVRAELKTEADQNELLDALAKDLSDQRRAVFTESGREGPANGPDGRRDWFEQLQSQLETFDRRSEKLIAIVLEPEQSKRLRELRLQREGARAFRRAEVQNKLELTEEQQEKISDVLKVSATPQFGPNFDFAQRREQLAKQEMEILATLTDEQKARWEEMKGEAFQFRNRRRSRR